MTVSLPSAPSLEQLKNQARDLQKAFKTRDPLASSRVQRHLPRIAELSPNSPDRSTLTLAEAQLVLAREYGFSSWAALKRDVESHAMGDAAALESFKEAVQSGSASRLRSLLRANPSLKQHIDDPVFVFDSPAIVTAAGRGRRDVVEALLDFGADIRARSSWWAGGFGVLPNRDPEFSQFLIDRGAPVDVWTAAALNRLDTLRELLSAEPELANARGGDGMGPLHYAAAPEAAVILLEHGAQIDMRDIDHHGTPAQTLVTERPDVSRYLISRGAELDIFMAVQLGDLELVRRALAEDPQALEAHVGAGRFTSGDSTGGHIYLYKLKNGQNPLLLAAELGRNEIYDFLVAQYSPAQQLIGACFAGDERRVQTLVSANPDLVRTLPYEHMRAIAHAGWSHKTDCVRLMLQIGFDIEARGDEDSTALNRAAVRGYADTIEVLLQHGASLEAKNKYGGRPLPACLWGAENFRDPQGDYVASVQRLLTAGATLSDVRYPSANREVNAWLRRYLDRLSRTSIVAAIRMRSLERVRALLERRPELAREPEDGLLPLTQAVLTNQADIAALLLEHGAVPDARERPDGPTAMETALNLGANDIAALLQSRPA